MTDSPPVDHALATLRRLSDEFGTRYPDDTTCGDRYQLRRARHGVGEGGNVDWTTSFYPGMLWLAGELDPDSGWWDRARAHVGSFVGRIDEEIDIQTHDLGFLYTLSCVTAWIYDADVEARRAALAAADHLMSRVLPAAGIIQAWGDLNHPREQGRAIIDSLMNLPLLYWASGVTGDDSYRKAAHRHALQLRENILREDDTTFHTFYWDPVTGAPLRGDTAQGFADDSTWARGQAWGIYGFGLNYAHTGDPRFLDAAQRCSRRFMELLPPDHIPYWDLVFSTDDGQERDSSSGAIAACGLMDLAELTSDTSYRDVGLAILDALAEHCASTGEQTCLLRHGVYNKNANEGVDEGNLWGDYYYLEALTRRARPSWVPYWRATS
ncbi:MAG: glycoside hydrolase family 88 protein [Arachnia sp.]